MIYLLEKVNSAQLPLSENSLWCLAMSFARKDGFWAPSNKLTNWHANHKSTQIAQHLYCARSEGNKAICGISGRQTTSVLLARRILQVQPVVLTHLTPPSHLWQTCLINIYGTFMGRCHTHVPVKLWRELCEKHWTAKWSNNPGKVGRRKCEAEGKAAA